MNKDWLSSRSRIALSWLVTVFVLAYVLFVPPSPRFSPLTRDLFGIVGLALLALAAFGRIWCLTHVAGRKNKVLTCSGPYSVVRNPLYVFSFLGAVGLGFAVENPFLSAALAILFAAYYSLVVRKEECKLAEIFGEEFREYCRRTPRWIPDLRLYREPETLTVSTRKVRRGILSATWFIWAFLLWNLLAFARGAGWWPFGV